MQSLKIVYFGSSGSLSVLSLRSLLAGPHESVAVVVHEPGLDLNTLAVVAVDDQSSVKTIAFRNNVNILRFNNSFTGIESLLTEIPFDLIVTSCFARKIPLNILKLARLGAVNLHPSLLPKYRGPDPVFWQLRDAVMVSGVTLHLMNGAFDEGFIIAQQSMKWSSGETLAEINENLGKLGTQLLIDFLNDPETGLEQAYPQNEGASTYNAKPDLSDYELFDQWEASRLVNFVRASMGRVPYYPITLKGKDYKVTRVLDYHQSIRKKLSIRGKKLCFPCATGFVCAEILTD